MFLVAHSQKRKDHENPIKFNANTEPCVASILFLVDQSLVGIVGISRQVCSNCLTIRYNDHHRQNSMTYQAVRQGYTLQCSRKSDENVLGRGQDSYGNGWNDEWSKPLFTEDDFELLNFYVRRYLSSTYLMIDKYSAIYLQWLKSGPKIKTMVNG